MMYDEKVGPMLRNTEVGKAFERFSQAHSRAWCVDQSPHASQQSLNRAWEDEGVARKTFLVHLLNLVEELEKARKHG